MLWKLVGEGTFVDYVKIVVCLLDDERIALVPATPNSKSWGGSKPRRPRTSGFI
jgi:hypothetical protein